MNPADLHEFVVEAEENNEPIAQGVARYLESIQCFER
jgi:hypothetical protein